VHSVLTVLCLRKAAEHPDEPKYRLINTRNDNFQRRVGRVPGGVEVRGSLTTL
jgi:hypothetical protein